MKQRNTKLIFLRALLLILIVLNMALIFFFSSENAEQSTQTSGKVTQTVAQIVVKDFQKLPSAEQEQITTQMQPPLRKLAHMTEFGSLGALIFLFLLTWKGKPLPKYGCSLAFVMLYAGSDELHQSFSDGRANTLTDVLIDCSGAIISCTLILLFLYLFQFGKDRQKLKTTCYFLNGRHDAPQLKIAVAADLHGNPIQSPLHLLQEAQPDLILIPGDLMDDADLQDPNASGYAFLRACAKLAPTYYSIGNHEIGCYHKGNPWRHPVPIPLSDEIRMRIAETGAVLLENDSAQLGSICLCGLTSGINRAENKPNTAALEQFAKADGFRILLCHHPEYYMTEIRHTNIDLIVCGHAHGGHWRIFGRGVYAPGQGLFPKYTSGVLDERCVISRGLGDHTHIPRFCNPRELVLIYYGFPNKEQNT